MLTHQPTQLAFAQLFDAMPDGVVYFSAVRDTRDQQIVDFMIDYANPIAGKTLQNPYQIAAGTLLRDNNRPEGTNTDLAFTQSKVIVETLKAVIETGLPNVVEYFNEALNEWLSVTRAKAGDGVLTITRIITASKQAALNSERQETLLNDILNTSLNTKFVYEAIRDDGGQIQDFRVLHVNERARQDVITRLGVDPVDKTLLEINPNARQMGRFDQFCQVIDSEQPIQTEQFYPEPQPIWYNFAITKLNDGVVLTGIDITDQKQVALEMERQSAENRRQANFLNKVLDASSNGIVSERAIHNEDGRIVDFLITSANQQAAQIVHSTVEALVGRSDLELHPELRLTGLFDAYVRTVETGQPQFVETYYSDGRLDHWLHVNTRKLADDELVITFLNVSDVKQTQQALEKSQANLQAVIDTSQTGIFVFSPVYDEAGKHVDFRFKTINRMVAALVGQTPDVVQGSVASDWFSSYQQTGLFDRYKHTFDTGEDQRFDIHYDVDGLDVWFDVKAVKFHDDVLVTYTDYTDLKQAKQAVEQQANLLGSILDSSNSGIIAFESIRNEQGAIVDFHFATVNQACERLLGLPLETMRGNKLLTLFPGNVETGLFALYVNTTETGEPGRTEVHYNLDGLDFWLDISAQKLGDGFVVTFSDISMLKRAQQAIEESATQLQNVINLSQTAIFLLKPVYDEMPDHLPGTITDFTYEALNQTLADYVKQTPEAMIGTRVSQWFPAYKTQANNFQRYCEVFQTGQPQRFETHYQGEGMDYWLDVSVARMEQHILVTFSDYTDLKTLQQQLEESATELQTIIDTSQTGIFLFSPVRNEADEVVDFRFRVANRMLAHYVGQEPEAIIGGLGSQWFPDYKTNGLFEAFRDTYLTGETQRLDTHYKGINIDVWLDIMSTKMGDEVLVTFGDYTPLIKLQQQLESSVEDLQRSNQNLEQFAYIASHDLQEPLRKIQAFGDIVETQYGDMIGEQGAGMIRRIIGAAARMQILIKDVLAYSQVATKGDAIKPVNLDELVASVVDDLETAIAEHKATVVVNLLPTVLGDAGQLRQLFQNLLSNALKFLKPHPAPNETSAPDVERAFVRITTQPVKGRDAGMPVLPGDADRLFHLIEIEDNGIGFEAHQAERIFQVFQRLHNRSNYAGSGIGLAIVKKVVENHNGFIQAVGRPGEGATFRLLLPALVG
ncbi:MAG: sensor signal transduction histidine kinase [Spirosoma sp.]|nr:sensor signal transduction histidine kinase [Spirosoma sp.]